MGIGELQNMQRSVNGCALLAKFGQKKSWTNESKNRNLLLKPCSGFVQACTCSVARNPIEQDDLNMGWLALKYIVRGFETLRQNLCANTLSQTKD